MRRPTSLKDAAVIVGRGTVNFNPIIAVGLTPTCFAHMRKKNGSTYVIDMTDAGLPLQIMLFSAGSFDDMMAQLDAEQAKRGPRWPAVTNDGEVGCTRQFVAVAFRPCDPRSYTYRWDGEPLAPGDRVVVSTTRGPSTVTVVSVSDQEPPFACKSIVGRERVIEPAETARDKLQVTLE